MFIRIKEFRKAHHLYQSELAEIIGVTQSVVSRMETKLVVALEEGQENALVEKFGREDVDRFVVTDMPSIIQENRNHGGHQNNGVYVSDKESMNVILQQSSVIADALRKQSEQTDRLLSLLEKLSEKP